MQRIGILAVILAVLIALGPATPSFSVAATFKGVDFPDSVDIAGHSCRLNGVGVRTRFFVKVYLGALYLATPTKDGAAAAAADEPKRTLLHFVHSRVEAEKVREALREGLLASVGGSQPQLAERLERFSGWFDQELLKGEQIIFTYVPGRGTEVVVKGGVRGVIEGADFMRALWSVWLGEKPVDDGLKQGMLGK